MSEQLSSSRVVARNAVFNVAGYAVSAAYVLVLLPVVVHFLGMEVFGLWSLVLAVTGYAGLVDLGLGTSFVKHIAEYVTLERTDKVNSVVYHGLLFYLGLSLLLLVAGVAAGALVFPLLGVPPDQLDLAWHALVLALLVLGFNSLGFVLVSVLSGLQRMDAYNMFQAVVSMVRFAALSLTLFLGGGLLGMLSADLAVSAVSLVPLWFLTRRFFPGLSLRSGGFDRAMFGRLFRFGAQLQVSRFAEVVQTQFDKLILAPLLGLSFVALYEFGSRPLIRLRTFPLVAMAGLLPAISSLDSQDNQERILAGVLRSTRYVVVFGLPVFVFVALFAQPIIRVWLGEGYALAAVALQVLSLGYFAGVTVAPLALAAQGRGEPRYQMQAALVQAGLNMMLSLGLLYLLGYAGAALGTCLASVAGAMLFIRLYGYRLMERPFAAFGSILGRPLIALVVALSAALAAGGLVQFIFDDPSRLGTLIVLVGNLATYLAFYGLMIGKLRVLGPDDRGFLVNILPRRLLLLFTRENA